MSKWERVSGQLDNKDLSACDYFVGVFLVFVFLFLLRYKIMAHLVINTPPPRSLAGGRPLAWNWQTPTPKVRRGKQVCNRQLCRREEVVKNLHKENTCVDTLTYAVGY